MNTFVLGGLQKKGGRGTEGHGLVGNGGDGLMVVLGDLRGLFQP